MTSEKARPIQSAEKSEPRFSKRRMEMRSIGGLIDWRVQPEKIPFELLDFNLGERWMPVSMFSLGASTRNWAREGRPPPSN